MRIFFNKHLSLKQYTQPIRTGHASSL